MTQREASRSWEAGWSWWWVCYAGGDSYLECPCCGDIAAVGLMGDGDDLLCGCVGSVSVDGEAAPYVMADECRCDWEAATDVE